MKKVCVFVFIFALIASSVFAAAYTVQIIEPPKEEAVPVTEKVKGNAVELTQPIQNTVQKTEEKGAEAVEKNGSLIPGGITQNSAQPDAASQPASAKSGVIQPAPTAVKAEPSVATGSEVQVATARESDTAADTLETANTAGTGRLKVNSKGNFRIGLAAGYSAHNGKYESTTGTDKTAYETELKTSFLTLSLLMNYKLDSPAEIYANIGLGFPESLTIDGKTHDRNNYWVKDENSKFRNNRGYTSVSLGGAYVFDKSDFVILAGGGINYNRLYRIEERRTTTTDSLEQLQKMNYEFSQFGLNLHFEARYDFNEYCELVGIVSPTISLSTRYREEYLIDGAKQYSIDRTASKINLDLCGTVGVAFKF